LTSGRILEIKSSSFSPGTEICGEVRQDAMLAAAEARQLLDSIEGNTLIAIVAFIYFGPQPLRRCAQSQYEKTRRRSKQWK
jgi:hypothetical protein